MRSPRRLRDIISNPDFVQHFGPPERHPDGNHQNIFGMDDELKTAPKGFEKTHPYVFAYRFALYLPNITSGTLIC